MERTFYFILSIGFFSVNEPLVLGAFFLVLLTLVVIISCKITGFIGYILFIIYVGGLIVLFIYVFSSVPMVTGRQTFYRFLLLPVAFFFRNFVYLNYSRVREIYDTAALLIVIGIVLFLVILSAVSVPMN